MRQCLDSILSQTFKDWECLLIDDGSTDESGSICDEYARRDNRFAAYHKENGGLTSARNYGLERSVGEWIMHVDGDDSKLQKTRLQTWYLETLDSATTIKQ